MPGRVFFCAAMAPDYTIRLATGADAAALLAIYAPYVRDTTVSFEYEVPTISEFAGRIDKVRARPLPWLLAERQGRVVGYAYAGPHRERAAYQWAVEVSVYVQAADHGTGVAGQLYAALFGLLRRQGYVNAYAGITLPNGKSEAFHRRCGFELVGTYRRVGYKFGAWRDVRWLVKELQEPPAEPAPPGPVPALAG